MSETGSLGLIECTMSLTQDVTLSFAMRGVVACGTPPLLLVHGYLDSWKSWSSVLPLLDSSIPLIAVTLRGWGDSSKTGDYSIAAYANDLALLCQKLGVEKVNIAGHSMGTLVATDVAAKNPSLINKLLLVGATPKVDPTYVVDPRDGTTLEGLGQFIESWPEGGRDLDFLRSFQLDDLKPFIETKKIPQAFAEQVMEETLKADPRAFKEAWRGMLDEDHSGSLATITAPICLIWGTADGVFPRQYQDAMVESLSATETELFAVEGAPHGTHWTHPEMVAGKINAVLLA